MEKFINLVFVQNLAYERFLGNKLKELLLKKS